LITVLQKENKEQEEKLVQIEEQLTIMRGSFLKEN